MQVVQVAKWGNSLAVRLSAKLVRELELKPGDKIELRRAGPQALEISRDEQERAERQRRLKAIATMRELSQSWPRLPEDYKFSREEIYGEGYRVRRDEIEP